MRIFLLWFLLGFISNGYALSWSDLWSTKDQQAQKLMKQGEFKQAETTFQHEDWRAAAAYRAGHYEQAAKQYQALQNESGYYNQGNALAHLGQYPQAIKAYDRALAINPNNKDALYNKKLIEELLKKNKNQQKKDQQNKNQQGQDQQNQDKQNKNQQGQDQQDKEQQGQSQQDKKKQEGKNKSKAINKAQSAKEREKQQAKEQWLRLIPDDPGGLMREKFLRDHLRREGGWY